MDEPLASLDAERKLEILPFIERLRDETSLPIVPISHALEEVARLAAKVVRLAGGHVMAEEPLPRSFHHLSRRCRRTASRQLSMITAGFAREMPEFGVTILAHPAGDRRPGRVDAESPPRSTSPCEATIVTLALENPINRAYALF